MLVQEKIFKTNRGEICKIRTAMESTAETNWLSRYPDEIYYSTKEEREILSEPPTTKVVGLLPMTLVVGG